MNEGLQVSHKVCPVCGKGFDILYCDLWAYKDQKYGSQGFRYYCSWKCQRAYERKHEPNRTLDDGPRALGPNPRKKQANSEDMIAGVLAEIEAGRDAADWLEAQGYDKWKKWYNLRDWARKHKPELYAKMPKSLAKKARTSA